jgi:mono/diheme cytochrome c family protein
MKNWILTLAAIVLPAAAAASCGGEEAPPATAQPQPTTPAPTGTVPIQQPPPVPTTAQGKQFFVETVYPSLAQTCGACHIGGRSGAPPWLGADANTAYDLIKSYKNGLLAGPISSNLLLLKELHAGGQQLNGQQKGIVQQWLLLEYSGDIDAPPTESFSQALENFSNCMNFNDWDGRDLDLLPLVPVTANAAEVANANCETCHLDAARTGSILLDSNNARATFDNFRIFPAILKMVNAAGFPFQQLIASRRLIDKGFEYQNCAVDQDLLDLVANGDLNNPDYCHPNYSVDGDAEDQLEFFLENTVAIANNGNCANQGQ